MEVLSGCRVESFGELQNPPEQTVRIFNLHGATWEAFTQAYPSYLAGFNDEELLALKDYCNYHRDNLVPEMARETALRIAELQAGVRVDVFSVVDIPRAIIDPNRVHFEGERPAFPPHIAERFQHMRDEFKQFHEAVQLYFPEAVRGSKAVFDLHSMDGWNLNDAGKRAQGRAIAEIDFATRLRKLVKIGTSDRFRGEVRRNNLFLRNTNGDVLGNEGFRDAIELRLKERGFLCSTDFPYNFFGGMSSTESADLARQLGIPYAIVDVDVKEVGRLPNNTKRGRDAMRINLDPKPHWGRLLKMSDALAHAICDTLKAAE